MKTLLRSTALIFSALLISLNIFATGLEFEPEQYIDDIPFDLEKIEKQVKYERALAIDFLFSDEEYINDIPFSLDELTNIRLYAYAVSQIFSFEDEGYIDDIPFVLSTSIVQSSEKLYAKVR